MKKKISNELRTHALAIAKNCKTIIKSAAKSDTKPASYTIIGRFDDRYEPEMKFAIRDKELEKFDGYINAALDAAPDYIDIKVYAGPTLDAMEISEAQNTIRLKERTATPKRTIGAIDTKPADIPASAHPDNQESVAFELRQQKFEAKMEADRKAFETQQMFAAKDKEIEELKEEIEDLQKDIAEYETGMADLKTDYESNRRKIGDAIEKGLGSIIAVAAQNPNGKIFGVIPASTINGFLGTGTPAGEQSAPAKQYARTETEQIAQYCDNLPDAEFNKLYSIFEYMAQPGNISILHSTLNKTNTSA